MADWFLDPRSLGLFAGAAVSVIISVWQGRQTAAAVQELGRWRLDTVVPQLSALRAEVVHLQNELDRLRDRLEGKG